MDIFECGNTRSSRHRTFEYVLDPDASGTTITFTCDIRPHGLMWLALPFLVRSTRFRNRDQLAALKRAMQSRSEV